MKERRLIGRCTRLLTILFLFIAILILFSLMKQSMVKSMYNQIESEESHPEPQELESSSVVEEQTIETEDSEVHSMETDLSEVGSLEIDSSEMDLLEMTLSEEFSPEIDSEPPTEDFHDLSETIYPRIRGLGNWTDYNGLIFGSATLYETTSGGGLAIGGSLTVNNNLDIGSTYTALYNPTRHIGEYKNPDKLPALLFGGNQLTVGAGASKLQVFGGPITTTMEMLEYNSGLITGFRPGIDSSYESINPEELQKWFSHQYTIVTATSDYLGYANDVSITSEELASGTYLSKGPDYYKNQFFEVNGEVYENALIITVRSNSNVNFGQWWPVHNMITVDVNWALAHNLVVFNFPDAVNVTMNASAFQMNNMTGWSTTVDGWITEEEMRERLALSERVVYNFPQAQTIEVNQSLIQGTILAPRATFTGIGARDAGHIYGHIIANHYVSQGNFTIHAFQLTHWIYDLVDDIINNEQSTGSIALRQYLFFGNRPTNIRLADSKYVVVDEDGHYYQGNGKFVAELASAAVYNSSFDEDIMINGLPYGDYTLQCIEVNQGLLLNENQPDNNYTYYQIPVQVKAENLDETILHFAEAAKTTIYFQKVDSLTRNGIKGAGFTIGREGDEYDNTTVGNNYYSGDDGIFVVNNLPIGIYHLMEVDVPEGYQIIDDGKFIFQVYWDVAEALLKVRDLAGNILEGTLENPIIIEDNPGTFQNNLLVVKYAGKDIPVGMAYTLPNVAFSLYQYDEERSGWFLHSQNISGEAFEIVTNALGYYRVDGLAKGIYRLVEVVAPPGYQLSNNYSDEMHQETFPKGYAYEFELNEKPNIHVAAISNQAYSRNINLRVTGDYLNQQVPLSGCFFRLERLLQDGTVWEEVFYAIETDINGFLTLTSMSVGTYRLTQLNSSMGYQPLEPGSFVFQLTFEEDGLPVLSASYDEEMISAESSPIYIGGEDGLTFYVENQSKGIGFSVYKRNAELLPENATEEMPYYLEGAHFRLMRRVGTRSPWEDYGDTFVSAYQYDEEGNPIFDSYGNHIAQAIFSGELLYGEYALAETQPPPGFSMASQVELKFDDGTIGKQIYLFYISEGMAESEVSYYHVAADYALESITDFRFRKVDMQQSTRYLTGSEFILYSCDEEHIHDEGIFPDACWTVNTPIIKTSDVLGLISFDGLLNGDYLLVETRAPIGYRLPVGYWLITLNAAVPGYQIVAMPENTVPAFLKTDNDLDTDLLLPNLKNFELPHTGGSGRNSAFVSGNVLILLAIMLFAIKCIQEGKKLS